MKKKLIYYLEMINDLEQIISVVRFQSEPSLDAIYLWLMIAKHVEQKRVYDWNVVCGLDIILSPKVITNREYLCQ